MDLGCLVVTLLVGARRSCAASGTYRDADERGVADANAADLSKARADGVIADGIGVKTSA